MYARHPNSVVLMRAAPGSSAARRLLDELQSQSGHECGGRLIFFHGPGVDHAVSGQAGRWRGLAGTDLMVCSSAWQRRHAEPPPSGWHSGSLTHFWTAADRAEELRCFGAGR